MGSGGSESNPALTSATAATSNTGKEKLGRFKSAKSVLSNVVSSPLGKRPKKASDTAPAAGEESKPASLSKRGSSFSRLGHVLTSKFVPDVQGALKTKAANSSRNLLRAMSGKQVQQLKQSRSASSPEVAADPSHPASDSVSVSTVPATQTDSIDSVAAAEAAAVKVQAIERGRTSRLAVAEKKAEHAKKEAALAQAVRSAEAELESALNPGFFSRVDIERVRRGLEAVRALHGRAALIEAAQDRLALADAAEQQRAAKEEDERIMKALAAAETASEATETPACKPSAGSHAVVVDVNSEAKAGVLEAPNAEIAAPAKETAAVEKVASPMIEEKAVKAQEKAKEACRAAERELDASLSANWFLSMDLARVNRAIADAKVAGVSPDVIATAEKRVETEMEKRAAELASKAEMAMKAEAKAKAEAAAKAEAKAKAEAAAKAEAKAKAEAAAKAEEVARAKEAEAKAEAKANEEKATTEARANEERVKADAKAKAEANAASKAEAEAAVMAEAEAAAKAAKAAKAEAAKVEAAAKEEARRREAELAAKAKAEEKERQAAAEAVKAATRELNAALHPPFWQPPNAEAVQAALAKARAVGVAETVITKAEDEAAAAAARAKEKADKAAADKAAALAKANEKAEKAAAAAAAKQAAAAAKVQAAQRSKTSRREVSLARQVASAKLDVIGGTPLRRSSASSTDHLSSMEFSDSGEADAATVSLMQLGHEANKFGDYEAARLNFCAASERCDSSAAKISAANMSFKLGDFETALAEYDSLLNRKDLSAERRSLVTKRKESARRAIESEAEDKYLQSKTAGAPGEAEEVDPKHLSEDARIIDEVFEAVQEPPVSAPTSSASISQLVFFLLLSIAVAATVAALAMFIYSPDSFDSELTFAKTANLALEMASSTQVRAVELTSSMGSAVSETYAKSYASTIHAAAAVAAASKKISMEMRSRAGAATDAVFSVSEALKENLRTHADAALDVYTAVAQRAYERLAEAGLIKTQPPPPPPPPPPQGAGNALLRALHLRRGT